MINKLKKQIEELEKEIKGAKAEHCDICDSKYPQGLCSTCKPEFEKLEIKLNQAKQHLKWAEELKEK